MELSFDIMKQFMKNAPVNIFLRILSVNISLHLRFVVLFTLMKMEGLQEKQILKSSLFQSLEGFIMRMIKKNAVRDSDGNIIGIVGIVSNVTNRVRLEKQVEELSIMDGLTQAYNRNYLKYKLEEKRKLLKYPFTVIMSDCNYLKTVNDQYGHEYGDILLRVVANTLKEIFPEDCPVIRMGGDEFLILANETSEEKAAILIQKVQEKLREKSKEKIPLSLAMGSHTINDGPFSIDEAISEADRKMYENKKATRK